MSSLVSFVSETFQFNILGAMSLSAAFLDLFVGLVILAKNPKSKISQSFFLFAFTTFLWLLSFGLHSLFRDVSTARTCLRVVYFFSVPFISPAVYLFSRHWIHQRSHRALLPLGFFFSILTSLWFYTFFDVMIESLDHSYGRYIHLLPNALGIGWMVTLTSTFTIFALLSFINFYKGWISTTNPKEKAQFRNIILGFIFAYSAAIDFVATLTGTIYPFGSIFFSIFILILAYTIVRYQFFDIKLLLKRVSFIFFIYAVLFLLAIPLAIPVFSTIFSQTNIETVYRYVGFSVFLAILFSLGPLIYAFLLRHTYWLTGHSSTGLTHELKSPLSTIDSASDIMDMELKKHPNARLSQYLKMIQLNTNRLTKSVGDLLTVAKSQEEPVLSEKEPVNLNNLAQSVLKSYQLSAEEKNLKLTFQTNLTGVSYVDKTQMQQVFSNLLSNAIKYSNKGTITFSLNNGGAEIQGAVQDEGKGIDPKKLDHVFDRFYQCQPNKGSGIGLTVAKVWVEAHGGKIWAESEGEKKGTTIKFTLPISS